MTAPVKTLVIWDLDNTLTDTLTFWATATGPAVESLSACASIPYDDLVTAIRKAPGQFRFCDFGRLVDWLEDNHHLGETPPRHELDALKTAWFETQRDMTVFYDGAFETLAHIKTRGAHQVIDTDTEASSLIRRVWLLARNAKARGQIETETDILSLFDHFYSQASIEDDSAILADIDPVFLLAMKNKMTIWRDGWKPAPDHARFILRDMNAAPQSALYIGDSAKDSGGARGAHIDFAWFTHGANVKQDVAAIARRIASPNYQYGLDAIRVSFNEASAPNFTLARSVFELTTMFDFAPGASTTANAAPITLSPAPIRLSQMPTREGNHGPATDFPSP